MNTGTSHKKLSRTNHRARKPLTAPFEPEIQKKIHLSEIYKGSTLDLSDDYLTVSGFKGYRSIRANYPITEGTYYFEFKIETPIKIEEYFRANYLNINEISRIEPHVRIGVCIINFDKEISLGSDLSGYAYKDMDGCVVHNGTKKEYGEKYGEGDIMGCLIHMKPPKPKLRKNDDFQEKENKIEINEGSNVYFFKNGKLQGEAYTNLNEGFYYAAVSLYMGAKVKANFGPDFEAPPNGEDFNALPEEVRVYKPYSIIAQEERMYEDIYFP